MNSLVALLAFFLLAGLPTFGWAAPAEVKVTADRVTIRAESTSLVDLLREIAQKAGISIVLRGQTGQIVTVDVEDAPLAEALNTLLRNNPGSAFVYAEDSRKGSRLVKAYVVLYGTGSNIAETIGTVTPEPANETIVVHESGGMPVEVAEERLREGSPEEFLQALATIYPKQKDALYAALRHPDASVRMNALTMLAEVGTGSRAKQAIEDAMNDTDMTVRSAARRLLGKGEEGGSKEARRGEESKKKN